MEQKNNATCAICDSPYYMCLSCKDTMKNSPWKAHTDTSEHYKVFQVISGYSTGVYNKEEAKSKLKTIDLSDLDSFKENIKNIIKDIMREDKIENKELVIEEPTENKIENKEIDLIIKADEKPFVSEALKIVNDKKPYNYRNNYKNNYKKK